VLLELSVENIAIIDRASISLGRGFTALTGETGAGKSLLTDAIALALGGRADSDLVRAGAAKGSVALLVDVSQSPAVLTKCAELGVEVEDGQLAVQRDLSSEGRSTVRLNGRPVSVGVLRELGALVVDLHGQHDHQALLVPERQVDFLDAWIGQEAMGLVADVADRCTVVDGLQRKLASLRSSRRDREQRVDMLEFQVQEIESVNPIPGESEELQIQIERLKHAEKLQSGAHQALNEVVEAEGSALEKLGTAVRELENLSPLDPLIDGPLSDLKESLAAMQEGGRALRDYAERLDLDPAALESCASRLDNIKRLFRKYGDTEELVLQHLADAKAELASLQDDGQTEEEVAAKLESEQAELNEMAAKLTALRTKKAVEFDRLVTGHARELAMEKAEFKVDVQPKPVGPNGADLVTFLFTANSGEPMRPLSKVASGGEISRIMLAIKVSGAGRAGVPTLIFDEVDTGLSGRAAAVTAKKLEELAQNYQVVVISHLPQIAARADTHFRIEKAVDRGRTVTQVTPLDGDDRLREIARMLAGEEIGESALANAREMLQGKTLVL